jgi:hypothetical protein
VAFLASRILALCLLAFGLSWMLVPILFVLIDVLQGLPGRLRFEELVVMNLVMATCLLYLGGLWLLWGKADWVSRKLVPDGRDSSVWPRVRLKDLQVVTFSAVGLVFFVSGLDALLEVVLGARWLQFWDQYAMVPDRLTSSTTIRALVKIGLGLVLMIGSRGIVRAIHRLRSVGWSDREPTHEELERAVLPPKRD